MTFDHNSDEAKIREILAGHALGDLTEEEQDWISIRLMPEHQIELEQLEKAAEALRIALGSNSQGMPAHLRDQIELQGSSIVAQSATFASAPSIPAIENQVGLPSVQHTAKPNRYRNGMPTREIVAWVAVAASLLLALGTWGSQGGSIRTAASDPAAARQRLIASATDLIKVDWAVGKTALATPVSGDIVWSTEKQAGYMRFVGLPTNIPSKEQYQLWIIDPNRDANPVDGGVFDIDTNGEVIIPINAKLQIDKPAAFAITVEKPGGVVVSSQDNLPLIAVVPEQS